MPRAKKDPLKTYREKRNLRESLEPPGITSPPGGSRFVAQKHLSRRPHFDFRLEMDGTLKSWAVPAGMPAESGIRRLAVEVEDHPLDYIDFSGTIPAGNYGAGTVSVWDRGHYTLTARTKDKLTFVLKGKKLRGAYALIHTRGKNWLVIKMKEGRT